MKRNWKWLSDLKKWVYNFYHDKKDSFNFYYLVFIWNILLFSFFFGISGNYINYPLHFELYTGTEGGSYSQFGKEISEVVESQKNFKSHVRNSDGDVENLRMLHDHVTGTSLALSTVGIAHMSNPQSKEKQENKTGLPSKDLSILLPLLDVSSIHIYKKRSHRLTLINEFKDIVNWASNDNLQIYLGREGSGNLLLMKELIELEANQSIVNLNLNYLSYRQMRFHDACQALLQGDLDIVILFGDDKMPVLEDLRKDRIIPLTWNTPEVPSEYLDSLENRYGEGCFLLKTLSGSRSTIKSNSALMCRTDLDPYFTFRFLKELDKKGSPYRTLIKQASENKNSDLSSIALHEGTRRYIYNNKFWSAVYWIKRNFVFFILPVIIVLFLIQFLLLTRLSYYQKATDETYDSPTVILTYKRMFFMLVILIGLTSIIFYLNKYV